MSPVRIRRMPAALGILVVALGAAAVAASGRPISAGAESPLLLPPARALPMRTDTLFLGGYASGSFAEALQLIASDLSGAERTMIGRHLDKMFDNVLLGKDLTQGGRLRVTYERGARADGSTRSIRVLAAETAVAGQIHTAFFFDNQGQPGYFSEAGRSLDPRAWVRPLSATRVTSPFGLQRLHPVLNRVLPHAGVDYAATSGTPVRATGDGSVAAAERRGGYGNLVEIQHPNGYTTRYAHLSRIAPGVASNTVIRQGDVIGYVGMTGLATGPHLHYEVRRQGRPVDPEQVSVETSPSADVRHQPAWNVEHRRLARLLGQAPRVTQSGRAGAGRL